MSRFCDGSRAYRAVNEHAVACGSAAHLVDGALALVGAVHDLLIGTNRYRRAQPAAAVHHTVVLPHAVAQPGPSMRAISVSARLDRLSPTPPPKREACR